MAGWGLLEAKLIVFMTPCILGTYCNWFIYIWLGGRPTHADMGMAHLQNKLRNILSFIFFISNLNSHDLWICSPWLEVCTIVCGCGRECYNTYQDVVDWGPAGKHLVYHQSIFGILAAAGAVLGLVLP